MRSISPPRSTTKSGKAQPDGSADVPVKTTVLVQGNPVASVQLVYVIGYGQETSLDMSSEGAQCCLGAALTRLRNG